MKNYFEEEIPDDTPGTRPAWMPMFISLMLVLLTIFIFLITYTRGSQTKVQKFREQFRRSLMLTGKGGEGTRSITDLGTQYNPARALINRMKSKGINKKLMDEFLTLSQIKDMEVRDGQRGVSIILPEVVGFVPGKNQLTDQTVRFLDTVVILADELPYLVEIKGYSTETIPPGYTDPLEFSAKRAALVYNYFINKEVDPVKLKVSGCGDAFKDSDVLQDKVELIFKTEDL
jgi:outer membrane protein OmpA-like peptidoglycan-associated protein